MRGSICLRGVAGKAAGRYRGEGLRVTNGQKKGIIAVALNIIWQTVDVCIEDVTDGDDGLDDPGGSPYLFAILWLFLSAFFSGSESALFSSDYIKLKSRFGNHRNLKRVLDLKGNPQAVLSSLLLGNTLVNVLFASSVAAICFARLNLRRGAIDLAATLIATVLVLIFGEITPKLLAGSDPEGFAVSLSPLFSFLNSLMRPFAKGLEKSASYITDRMPGLERRSEEITEARLYATVDYVENSGAIRNDEKEMIIGVIETKELEAVDVMVPRPRMIALQEERTALDALNVMLSYGVSRIPLFSESRDHITGIVSLKDLLSAEGQDAGDWQEMLRQRPARSFAVHPHFVPEGKKVSDLLREMKSSGIHMSIVVDEFDGVSGLVTLEDLLEEIVGDIRDEYDPKDQSAFELEEGVWQVPGHMSLSDLESLIGLDVEVEDCDSVAGVIMERLDRVPLPGDSFDLDDPPLSFEVKEVDGPRIKKVIIRKIDTEVSSKNGK
jgi:putative hemolysin